MAKYRAILFDLDGTLLDTLEDLADSVNMILGKYGFAKRNQAEIRGFLGNGSEKLMRAALPEKIEPEKFASYLEEYKAYYGMHMEEKTEPYAGIPELLEELQRAGLQIGVVSNKFDMAVKRLCEKYFPENIHAAAGERETEGIRRKPAPDMLLSVADELGAKAQDCLYVGDSEVDILTAEHAGMDCVSVAWGFRDEEFLKKAGATHVVHTPEELKKWILC